MTPLLFSALIALLLLGGSPRALAAPQKLGAYVVDGVILGVLFMTGLAIYLSMKPAELFF